MKYAAIDAGLFAPSYAEPPQLAYRNAKLCNKWSDTQVLPIKNMKRSLEYGLLPPNIGTTKKYHANNLETILDAELINRGKSARRLRWQALLLSLQFPTCSSLRRPQRRPQHRPRSCPQHRPQD